MPEPPIPKVEPYSLIEKLQKEKEVCGLYLSGHPLDDYRYEWESFAVPIEKIDGFKGRKVNLAGFVSRAEHRISQKGTGWGRFTIQDYSGSHEITLFSESYLKFKHLFEEGTCLFLSGTFQQRYNSDEWELKLMEVKQLATIGAERTESVTLKINVELVNEPFLAEIERLCLQFKGKHALKMELVDLQNRLSQPFLSGKKVQADNDFRRAVLELGLEFSVN